MTFIKLLTIILAGAVLFSCSAGISLRRELESGAAAAPMETVVDVNSGGTAFMSSDSLRIFVSVSPTSYRGGARGETLGVTDPFLEAAMEHLLYEGK